MPKVPAVLTTADIKKNAALVAIELFCREFRSQVAKCETLVNAMEALWARLEKEMA